MIYYVSSSEGNDDNNGLSLNDPFKSLKKITNMTLKQGDKVLLKCGDIWHETLTINIEDTFMNDKILVGSYGIGEKPTLSFAKIHKNNSLWESYNGDIYKIDLSNNNLEGAITDDYNVGFILDKETDEIYYNRVNNINDIKNPMDFYVENTFVYMKCESDPNNRFNELWFVLRANLIRAVNNMHIDGLRLQNTGAHGIVGCQNNCVIENCVINNCGGSVLFPETFTRFGNGIELSTSNNILIKNNIISNCYDVGCTIQGTNIISENVLVINNKFLYNSQALEIWTLGDNTNENMGIKNFIFKNNISVGSGRGWGSKARPDKYGSCEIMFHGITLKHLDVLIEDNIFINPNQLYYINREIENGTTPAKFISHVKSRRNKVYMCYDKLLINGENYTVKNIGEFISEYNKEQKTQFNILNDENAMNSLLHELMCGSNLSIDNIVNPTINTNVHDYNNIYNQLSFPVHELYNDNYIKFADIELDRLYSSVDLTLVYSLTGPKNYDDIGLLKIHAYNPLMTDCDVDIYCQNNDGKINKKSFVAQIEYLENNIKISLYYNTGTEAYSYMNIKIINLSYNFVKNVTIGIDTVNHDSIDNCIYTRFKLEDKFKQTTPNGTTLNMYTKICDIKLSKEYETVVSTINYSDIDNNNIISGDLKIKAKTNDMNSTLIAQIALCNNIGDNITKDSFIGVVTEDNSLNKILEIYFKPTYHYALIAFTSLDNGYYDYKRLNLYSNNGFIEELPEGTIVECK